MLKDDKANNLLYEIFTTSEVSINRQQSDNLFAWWPPCYTTSDPRESQVVINERLLKCFDHVAFQAQHLHGRPNTLLETELLKQNFYSGNSGRLQTKQNLHACSSNSIQMPGNSPKQIFSIFGISNLVCICLTFACKTENGSQDNYYVDG